MKPEWIQEILKRLESSGMLAIFANRIPPDELARLMKNPEFRENPELQRILALYEESKKRQSFVSSNFSTMATAAYAPQAKETLEAAERIAFESLQFLAGCGLQDSEHAATATTAIASARRVRGDYEQAAGFLEHAMAIRKRIGGVHSTGYLTSLRAWVETQIPLGRMDRVVSRVEEALRSLPEGLDGNDDVCTLQAQLASYYRHRGYLEQARPLLQTALRSAIRSCGLASQTAAEILAPLGALEIACGNLAAARESLRQLREATGGITGVVWADHARYASAELAANVAWAEGDPQSEAKALEHALQIARSFEGNRGARVVECSVRLAELWELRDQNKESRQIATELLSGTTALNPGFRRRLLGVLMRQSEGPGRIEFARRYMQASAEEARMPFGFLNEQQLLQTMQRFWTELRTYIAFVLIESDVSGLREAYSLTAEFKGRVAESFCISREKRLAARYPQHRVELERLTNLRREVQNNSRDRFWGLSEGEADRAANRIKIEKETIEAELGKSIPELRLDGGEPVSLDALASSLGEIDADCALVDYVFFEEQQFSGYLVVVVPANEPGLTWFTWLGESAVIDEAVRKLRKSMNDEREGLTAQQDDDISQLVWQPVENGLDEIRASLPGKNFERLIICPDGALSLLPFQVLPMTPNGNTCLIDRYEISYTSSPRDILTWTNDEAAEGSKPLVLGLCEFGAAGELPEDERRILRRKFRPLRGAEREALEVAQLLNGEMWIGSEQVTKGRLLERLRHVDSGQPATLASPRTIHIASHSFSLAPEENTTETDPLERSGLALANANRDAHSGILTAREVSGLDLRDTRLAVLSACDTGLGAILNGEGVFGLQRAFRVAGVRTLLMALWEADDTLTPRLMILFYKRLHAGLSCSAALRQTQLILRSRGYLRTGWSGIVCHGDPRPIVSSDQP